MESKLPLGICRHCISALEVALSDINEVIEDDEVVDNDKEKFEYMAGVIGDMMATITVACSNDIDEDSFMAEHIDYEPFGEITSENDMDILDTPID